MGGEHLNKNSEFQAVGDARELLVMGSTEILGRLPRILKTLRALAEKAKQEKPELAILVDYPDFHLRLASKLKAFKIPVVYYIPPKVWVWRKRRIKKLKENFIKLFCIFPFEVEFYRKEGVSATFVGNPLLDELPLELSRESARIQLGLHSDDCVMTLMPGSRPGEIKYHFRILVQSTRQAVLKLREMGWLRASQMVQVLIPVPAGVINICDDVFKGGGNLKSDSEELKINWRILEGGSATCLRASDAALVKSGTATLEAGLLGCPHGILYTGSLLSNFIFFNLIRYQGPVGLVNLVGGWKPGIMPRDSRFIVREFLGSRANVDNLSNELISLLMDKGRRERMKEDFKNLSEMLKPPQGFSSPSDCLASEILGIMKCVSLV